MTLIVEDGTLIANANSYIDLADTRTYALARGVTLSAVDADLEVLVIKAMDYIESFRSKFKGVKYDTDQALQWPRNYVYIDNILIDYDTIPQELINALAQTVVELNNGVSLYAVGSTDASVLREKVDVIEIEYEKGSSTGTVTMPVVASFLDILLQSAGSTYAMNLRV